MLETARDIAWIVDHASPAPKISNLASLGLFVFRLQSVPFQQMQRQTSWKHASGQRVGARPLDQFLGPDADNITLSGELYPELTGGVVDLDELRGMGDLGAAWPLIDGSGYIYGDFTITDISETRSVLMWDGSPRKIEFSLSLKRVPDDLDQPAPASNSTGP
ncbi:phage tail protein [Silvimonas sp.]|uniref:phage tail protein n=1 Tax=Silvimonas sp. TaxID=2650811 RepID=UPI00284ACC50|nr:phage tail protein [Silvimonas sp.]MDR3429009.1 phage tail protein [Silvimonas sp.]